VSCFTVYDLTTCWDKHVEGGSLADRVTQVAMCVRRLQAAAKRVERLLETGWANLGGTVGRFTMAARTHGAPLVIGLVVGAVCVSPIAAGAVSGWVSSPPPPAVSAEVVTYSDGQRSLFVTEGNNWRTQANVYMCKAVGHLSGEGHVATSRGNVGYHWVDYYNAHGCSLYKG